MVALALTFLLAEGFGMGVLAFPEKPIKAIIGYEAGSSSDISARAIFQIMEKDMGQAVMVVNKPGAASSMAMREVFSSKPDGYTIGVTCSVNVFKLLGLMPADHHDFDLLAVPSVSVAAVAVPAKSPFKTVKELVEYAKAHPGELKCSTTSKRAIHWMQAKDFERAARIKFNVIANPGGASYVASQVGGGHADLGVAGITALKSQRDAGNLRFLAVMAEERVVNFDDIPTLKENGYHAAYVAWQAYVAPKGLPQEVHRVLTTAFAKAAASQEYKNWCLQRGRIPTPRYVGEEAVKFLDQDREVQKPILEEIGAIKKK